MSNNSKKCVDCKFIDETEEKDRFGEDVYFCCLKKRKKCKDEPKCAHFVNKDKEGED